MLSGAETIEENRESLEALTFLEKGIPGASTSEGVLQRGLTRGLYDASRVKAAKEMYPTRMAAWIRGDVTPAPEPITASGRGKMYNEVITILNILSEDSRISLTPETFAAHRPVIDDLLFYHAMALGIPDAAAIHTSYQLELVHLSGGSALPSAGRLGYIKGHLETLRQNAINFKP